MPETLLFCQRAIFDPLGNLNCQKATIVTLQLLLIFRKMFVLTPALFAFTY